MSLTSDQIGGCIVFRFIFAGLFMAMVCVVLELVAILVTLCRSLIRRTYASPSPTATPAPAPPSPQLAERDNKFSPALRNQGLKSIRNIYRKPCVVLNATEKT